MSDIAEKRLRVGIVGCGSIANQHINAYLNMPDVDIVAGCDIVDGRAAEFMSSYGLDVPTHYKNHEEMLTDKSLRLDAVSVCTYNRQHVPVALCALNNGIHVLLEKPMCVDIDEAWELYRAVKRTGLVLSVGFQPRFDENMKDLCRIVDSGILGKVYYVQTGGGRPHGIPVRSNGNSFIRNDTAGTGALGDIGCYSLDMVLNALGHPRPLTVSGVTTDYFGKSADYYNGYENPEELAEMFSVDDFGAGFIRFEGGLTVDFRISWAMNLDTTGDTIFYGTRASLRIPSTECWNGSIGGPMKLYHTVEGKQVVTEIPEAKEGGGDKPYIWNMKIRSFLDAVKGLAPTPAPVDEIIYNQAILSGIMTSSRTGREVVLDFSEMER